MPVSQSNLSFSKSSRKWGVALWVLQCLLAGLYAFSGVMNTFMSTEELIAMGMSHANVLPIIVVRFIGLVELLGAFGLILPAALRVFPKLTSYTALGFVLLQIFAMIYHIIEKEFFVLPINATLLVLAGVIWWGRTNKAVIRAS